MERELKWLDAVASGDPKQLRLLQAMLDNSPGFRDYLDSTHNVGPVPNMSLDTFVSKYQSEDDEAFQAIM